MCHWIFTSLVSPICSPLCIHPSNMPCWCPRASTLSASHWTEGVWSRTAIDRAEPWRNQITVPFFLSPGQSLELDTWTVVCVPSPPGRRGQLPVCSVGQHQFIIILESLPALFSRAFPPAAHLSPSEAAFALLVNWPQIGNSDTASIQNTYQLFSCHCSVLYSGVTTTYVALSIKGNL